MKIAKMTRFGIRTASVVMAVLALTTVAFAQGDNRQSGASIDALKAEVERLNAELKALRSEVDLIGEFLRRQLSQPQQAPQRRVKISVGDSPSLGKVGAPVTLIEFSDYECPYCRDFFNTTFPALKKEFIDTGKLRYVFRDFPLEQIHPFARNAAEAARCAGDQGKYWEMHDVLFRNQPALDRDDLAGYAAQIQLDANTFRICLDTRRRQAEVQNDFQEGALAGVRGTPSFVLGKTGVDGSVEAQLVTGARPLAFFVGEIERLLTEKQH